MAVKCPVHHGQAVGGWPSFFTSYTLGTLCLTLSPPPLPRRPHRLPQHSMARIYKPDSLGSNSGSISYKLCSLGSLPFF